MKRGWIAFFGLLPIGILSAIAFIVLIRKARGIPTHWGFPYSIATGFAFLSLVALVLLNIPWGNFNAMPEQRVQVEAGHKQEILKYGRVGGYYHVVTFELPDGSSIRIDVKSKEVFDSIQEGDKGILTYKEKEARKGFLNYFFHDFSNKLFISFELE